MKKKVLIGFFAIALLMLLIEFFVGKQAQQIVSSLENPPVKRVISPSPPQRKMKAALDKIASQNKEKIQKEAAKRVDKGDIHQHLIDTFDLMWMTRDLFSKEQLRRELVKERIDNQAKIDELIKIAAHKDYAIKQYGKERQASARLYAVKILGILNQEGHSAPLLEAVKQMVVVANQAGFEPDQGQLRDVEDLIFVYVQSFPAEDIRMNYRSILSDLSYHTALPPPIRNIYDDVLYFTLKGHYGPEMAKVIAGEAFNG